MFLHGGWFHLISNMWALYIFGDNVEDRLGPMRYLLFYLVCGVVAALAHVYSQPLSNVPVVGASGAISGVLGAYLVLYPRARVISLVPLWIVPWFIEIPAVFYLGFWFFSQLFSGLLSLGMPISTYGGVAWWAHVGGFIAGLLLVKILEQKRTYPRWHLDEYHPW
jgi:membrane associated rhomboid family serine protease